MKTPEDFLSRGKGNFINCTDYDDAIQAMKEFANQSKWISVEERLPEEKEGHFIKYIVVFSGIVTTAKYTGGNWYLSMPQEDEKLDETDLDALTHWQPLPTAPIKSPPKNNEHE